MTGRVTIEWNGDAFIAKAVNAADDAVGQTALFVQRQVSKELRKTTGRVTGKSSTGRNQYSASLPGTPPGRRSGRLANSITTARAGTMRYRVGTNLEYARPHEMGATINHPGGTRWIMSGGRAVFISKAKAAELEGRGFAVGKTRPHTITMPKRPFLVPTLNRLDAEGAIQTRFNSRFRANMRAAQ